MSDLRICPVCAGKGTVYESFYTGEKTTSSYDQVTCKSCGGTGIIIINN